MEYWMHLTNKVREQVCCNLRDRNITRQAKSSEVAKYQVIISATSYQCALSCEQGQHQSLSIFLNRSEERRVGK